MKRILTDNSNVLTESKRDLVAAKYGDLPAPASITNNAVRRIPRVPVQAQQSGGYIMPGRIVYVTQGPNGEWELPTLLTTPGGLTLVDDPKNEFTEKTYYGIVVRTGVFTHSQHTHMHPDYLKKLTDIFGEQGLPAGTLILHSLARPMKDSQARTRFCTADHLIAFWLPTEVWPAHIEALRTKE